MQLLGKGSKALQRCVQILVRLLLTNDLQRNYSLAGRQKKRAFKELRMGKILLGNLPHSSVFIQHMPVDRNLRRLRYISMGI